MCTGLPSNRVCTSVSLAGRLALTGRGGGHVVALIAEPGAVVTAPADVGRADGGQDVCHGFTSRAPVIALYNTGTTPVSTLSGPLIARA